MSEAKYRNISELAKEANRMVMRKETEDGIDYAFDNEAMMTHNPIAMALLDAIEGFKMDTYSMHQFMKDALEDIVNNSSEDTNIEELRDNVFEWADNDTDVYTSDLTEWLNRSEYNVYYLTDAMDEGASRDGFNLLQIAQLRAREEIYNAVIDALESLMDSED